jgi:hypothetical protein
MRSEPILAHAGSLRPLFHYQLVDHATERRLRTRPREPLCLFRHLMARCPDEGSGGEPERSTERFAYTRKDIPCTKVLLSALYPGSGARCQLLTPSGHSTPRCEAAALPHAQVAWRKRASSLIERHVTPMKDTPQRRDGTNVEASYLDARPTKLRTGLQVASNTVRRPDPRR